MLVFGAVMTAECCVVWMGIDLRRLRRLRLMNQMETVVSVSVLGTVVEKTLWKRYGIRNGLFCHDAVVKPD